MQNKKVVHDLWDPRYAHLVGEEFVNDQNKPLKKGCHIGISFAAAMVFKCTIPLYEDTDELTSWELLCYNEERDLLISFVAPDTSPKRQEFMAYVDEHIICTNQHESYWLCAPIKAFWNVLQPGFRDPKRMEDLAGLRFLELADPSTHF